jgi:hypothetical protein
MNKPRIAKGKILRVKQGYNPNSSSMGSIVYILPAALLAITTGFGVISGIILAAFMKDSDKKTNVEEQK